MYKKVDTSLDFVEREKEIIKFWQENNVFEESVKQNEGGEEFSFYDGPPTANGKPHIGHILTRVIKDIIPRYQTMKGKHVLRKAGWDTHGLPVELEVEKTLGFNSKPDIENYGIEPFIKKCKESVWKYTTEWKTMSDRVGYWCDMDHPYVTYHDNYIESEWWALKEIANKGLLYKGHKIVPYCPRCGTALSSHEVAQGYKDVKATTCFVKFKVKKAENLFLVAWTTTPWTLPSNVALCMNPEYDYAEIEYHGNGERYILAKDLIANLFKEEEYTVVSVKKGSEYEYLAYEPLYTFAKFREKAYYVTNDAYVTLTDGTGIVHIAPAFGEDDHKVGLKYNLPVVNLVDDGGHLLECCGRFAGMPVVEFHDEVTKQIITVTDPVTGEQITTANDSVMDDLKARGLLLKKMELVHTYPFCWRCDTPLVYYARASWFVKVTAIKDQLIASNRSVNWMPESIKEGRMGNFLENVIDWGLSRNRYWGTPLPVWLCEDCGEMHVMGSKAELKELCGVEGEVELHRPYLDNLTCKCPKCGGKMKREPEVIDCWFDSGSMPFAQYHYPFENKELFEQTFPADFISEAIDQTRGWFYTLLVISTLLFGKAPFKNCIVLGHVNDKEGRKMSKHIGNVVDPWSVLDKQGADAVRWYFYTASSPWIPTRFDSSLVSETQRKFMGTLWNTYAFFTTYAEIDGYDPSKYNLKDCKLSLMDRWILSKLNTLVKTVDNGLSVYNITDTARAMQDFADVLSNWYVRVCRERYWGNGMTEDKIAADTTLYTVLLTMAKLSAPYIPFMAEQIYLNLVPSFYPEQPKSVHLCSFPVADESYIDSKLEKQMQLTEDIVVLGRSARNTGNLKIRQPLNELFVVSDKEIALTEELQAIVLSELNIKKFTVATDLSSFVTYTLKPQLKTLGKKCGKKIPLLNRYLADCDAKAIVDAVKNGGSFKVDLDGEVELLEEDLQIFTNPAEGYVSATDNGITVELDVKLTEELILEGTEREITSKIQSMRKEAGFEVVDRICVYYTNATGKALEVLKKANFAPDVLAEKVEEGSAEGYTKTLKINEDDATITVVKL